MTASSMQRALIIDDEPDILELLSLTLERMGLSVTKAADLAGARERLSQGGFDLCLTDMRLPDGDGLDLVRDIQRQYPELPVAVITAHGSMETAVDALKAGAFDFVAKPVDLAVLRRLIQAALRLAAAPSQGKGGAPRLLGDSQSMQQVRDQVARVARTQAPVFIRGESGTGKELVARQIHAQSPRADRAFVPVNCGAIPPELMESEFFGHKKGSFSGAVADKTGLFQAAGGGTLFLDEVADLPLALQVKLLRVLQEKKIRPVGAVEEVPVDVRILSATHKPLEELVAAGSFRQDLFYRIHVIAIAVPPLRERREDIPLLTQHFLAQLVGGAELPEVSPEAAAALQAYDFPGNVRELENVLERALALSGGGRVEVADLGLVPRESMVQAHGARPEEEIRTPLPQVDERFSLEDYLGDIERKVILEALEATGGNRSQAARRLGMTLRQLNYRLQKWQEGTASD